jgi:hypothetical protein
MNRLLTLASGGLFATSLAILPISAFAQQNGPNGKTDAKPVAPVTQTITTDAKTPAAAVKTEAAAKPTVVTKEVKKYHARRIVRPSVKTAKLTVPMTHSAIGVHPSATPAIVQPKVVDQSKS